ncbi:MAG TPA: enhanced serine sensitivity protein SseB C-terminal domain-containing protein [Gemmatales bacterium]|nr:enhanced serine sensitivity protein SseB C-terminal domain-containing protein [Gemmatales bacterium]
MGLLDWFRKRLPLPPGKSHELPEGVSAHDAQGPEFIGQQQGGGADLLHTEFRPALSALPQVKRAYFCKLRYPGAGLPGAAVCVVSSTGEDIRVVEALATVIRANLGSGSHIDILFLSPSLEARLSSVCQPFYKQGELNGGGM